jgi:hypothetical protein
MVPSMLRNLVGRYNIGEMAIVFSICSAGAVFVVVALGFLLSLIPGISPGVLVRACVGIWFSFVVWLWACFVVIGREGADGRTSTTDITVLQVVILGVAGLHLLFGPEAERPRWHQLALGAEWLMVFFHLIYFSLAWPMRASVPIKTYALTVLLVVLVWVQST